MASNWRRNVINIFTAVSLALLVITGKFSVVYFYFTFFCTTAAYKNGWLVERFINCNYIDYMYLRRNYVFFVGKF